MTCACRMQSYVCKELGKNIIYLSPMRITQRAIVGYDVPDTHHRPVNLDPIVRVQVRIEMRNEIKYNAGMYIYRAMKKVWRNGCILAAHHFG